MLRTVVCLILFAVCATTGAAMDFGLRFKSHTFPTMERTSLAVGNSPFDIDRNFKVGFFFNFYDTPLFGNLLSLTTDDGQRISVVASNVDDGSYRLGLVINDRLSHLKTKLTADPDKEDHIDLELDKDHNTVRLLLNNEELESALDLSASNKVTVTFGVDGKARFTDVAPFDLRNIRIFSNGRNTHHWDFKYHNSETVNIDNLEGAEAVATNPHWLIDDHTDWTPIYSLKTADKIQTAFDPDKEVFHIVDNGKIKTLNPLTGDSTVNPIADGHRVMAFSNNLVFNPKTNSLLNYNLDRKRSVILDLDKRIWSHTDVPEDDEPNYCNHAVAIVGDTLITFGGYGFYKFHNDVFTINLSDGVVTEHKLNPPLMPMTSSAAAVVDDKLYIFGGKGNESGRQELPSEHSYAMYEYDIHTWQGKELWKLEDVDYPFIPSQTMYYDKDDDSFYMATSAHGGELIRIFRTSPQWNIVSTPIRSKMDYHDFVFDLYRSKDQKRYYLLIDKRLDPKNHDYTIYTISAPFLHDEQIINTKSPNPLSDKKESGGIIWLWIAGGVLLAIALVSIILKVSRKRKTGIIQPHTDSNPPQNNDSSSPETAPIPDEKALAAPAPDTEPTDSTEDEFTFMATEGMMAASSHFDRSRSSISFLGGFAVHDKEGNDITVKFTTRLKHLLVMLLLTSLKYESGVRYQLIDEEIWGDKDEKAAQNNRNVSMRKLRLLLEEVGTAPINYDKGFFRIETNDIMFDYKELITRMAELKGADSVDQKTIEPLLELLLMGPMLPNTTYEWLDKYKADFSDSALEMLSKLLKYELGRDDRLAYRIAETISLHDALNEDALFAKCQVLSRRKMLGLARNIYTRYCKDYEKSMGEPYPVSFADTCKSDL